MSLLEQQKVLARLITDPDLRQRFLSDPSSALFDVQLRDDEIEDLLKATEGGLSLFADSLIWKRLREVEKLLPITGQTAGGRFRKLFFEFAPTFNPQTIRKHYEDAVAFSRYMEGQDPQGPAGDAARFERTRLTFTTESRLLACCRSRYDLGSKPAAADRVRRRKRTAIAVWLRLGRRVFHFVI